MASPFIQALDPSTRKLLAVVAMISLAVSIWCREAKYRVNVDYSGQS